MRAPLRFADSHFSCPSRMWPTINSHLSHALLGRSPMRQGVIISGLMAINHAVTVRVIQALWLIFWLYWLARAFNNKKSIYRQPFLSRLGYAWPLIIAAIISTHWSGGRIILLPASSIQRVVGIILCAGGFAFAIWARTILGRNWSGIATVKENHELICRGPYKIVRHPIYTGLVLAFLGTFIAAWPTVGGVILVVAMILALWIKAQQEEKLMRGQFPEAYPAYRQRVRSGIIPFLL